MMNPLLATPNIAEDPGQTAWPLEDHPFRLLHGAQGARHQEAKLQAQAARNEPRGDEEKQPQATAILYRDRELKACDVGRRGSRIRIVSYHTIF